jgi:hypothetical protein
MFGNKPPFHVIRYLISFFFILFILNFFPFLAHSSVIVTHVFDDHSGLPIAGAELEIQAVDGVQQQPPIKYISDEQGRVTFSLAAGSIRVEVLNTGYSPSDRTIDLTGSVIEALDFRLTPLGNVLTLSPATPSAAIDDDTTLAVSGLLSDPIDIQATIVSQQGINFPLPLGWSPVFAIAIDTDDPPTLPSLTVTTANTNGLTAASDPVLAYWDSSASQWTAGPAPVISGDGLSIDLSIGQTGLYVLAVPDTTPTKPTIPSSGATLQGVTFSFSPADSVADVTFNPLFLVVGGVYRSMAQMVVTTTQAVPSGYHLKARFLEEYVLADGSQVVTPVYFQDIALYDYPADGNRLTLDALLPVTPRRQFAMGELSTGKVNLSVLDQIVYPVNASAQVMDATGGQLTFEDGVVVQFDAGAVSASTAVDAKILAGSEIPSFDNSDLTFAGGIDLRLSEENIANPLGLRIGLNELAAYPDQTAVIIAKHVSPYSSSDWTVAATGKIFGGIVIPDACSTAKCFLGISGSGRYALFVPQLAFGFVTGITRDTASNPLSGAAMRVEELPFSYSSDTSGQYIAVALQGDFTLAAEAAAGEFIAQQSDAITAAGEVKTIDLVLRQTPFAVESVQPLDKQVRVSTRASVAVVLSKAIDKATVNSDSFSLTYVVGDQRHGVKGGLTVAEDKEIHFIPQAELPDNMVFTLELSDGIKDLSGNALTPFISTFTTADILENDLVSPGALVGRLPDENSDSTIMGGLGVAASNTLITITNTTTHAVTSVTSTSNGSFEAIINMALTDVIEVSVSDAFGTYTDIQVLSFVGPEGEFLVRPDYDNISSFEDVWATIEAGSVDEPIIAQVIPIQPEDVIADVQNNTNVEYLGGASVDLEGHVLEKEMKVSIPSPGGVTGSDVILVVKVININGTDHTTLVNIAKLTADNRLETASPPFPGIIDAGIFYFLKAIGAPGFVVVPVVVKAPEGAYITTPWGWVYVEPGAGVAVIPVEASLPYDIQLINASTGTVEDSVSGTAPDSGEILTTEEILTDDNTPPQVIGGAVLYEDGHDLEIGEKITITFDEEMDANSFNQSTLPIALSSAPTIPLNGTYQLINNEKTMRFLPEVPIPLGIDVTVEAKSGIKDLAGNELAQNLWNLRYFKPFVIATINRPVRDMEILDPPGKSPYLMFLETVDDESHLVAVDISDAAAIDQSGKATDVFTWHSGFDFNALKVASGIGPITGKDGTVYGSGQDEGDFAFVVYNVMGELLNSAYLQKSYPGHSLLHVLNIDDPLNTESVNLHILSVSPTEQWVDGPTLGNDIAGLAGTAGDLINDYLSTTIGGDNRFPGTWTYPRDIENLGNLAFISNNSFGYFDEDKDYLVGIQAKDVSEPDDPYTVPPDGPFPQPEIDAKYLESIGDNEEHFFGIDMLTGLDDYETDNSLLAVDVENDNLLVLRHYEGAPDFFVQAKINVPNISYGVTAIDLYEIDFDNDGNYGEDEDNDSDDLTSYDQHINLAVAGCKDQSLCVFVIESYGNGNLTDYELLAEIPLPSDTSGYISVNKETQTAFVPLNNVGIAIVDFGLNEPKNDQLALIDKNNDNKDDRILDVLSTGGATRAIFDGSNDPGRASLYVEDYLKQISTVQVGCKDESSNIVAIGNGESEVITQMDEKVFFDIVGCNLPQDSSYLWDFGDGTTSDIKSPNHSFSERGIYNVTVTMTCNSCEPKVLADQIKVYVGYLSVDIDSNNDLTIDDTDDKIEEDKPLIFWTNDNANDSVINGELDLINLATFRIKKMDWDNLPSNYKIILSLDIKKGNPEIRVFPRIGENLNYLNDEVIAKSQIESASIGLLAKNQTINLDLDDTPEIGSAYLFEAKSQGECNLKLSLIDGNGAIIDSDKAFIKILDIRDMYAIANARSCSELDAGDNCVTYQDSSISIILSSEKPNIVAFVHGYNVPEEDAIKSFDDVFKRLYWMNVTTLSGSSEFIGITWNGNETSMAHFNTNIFNAFQASESVGLFLEGLTKAGKTVNVLAHSLGNMLVSNAIKINPNIGINNYILHQAAVAANAYNANYDGEGVSTYRWLVDQASEWGYPNDKPWEKVCDYCSCDTEGDCELNYWNDRRWTKSIYLDKFENSVDYWDGYFENVPNQIGDPWGNYFSAVPENLIGKMINTFSPSDCVVADTKFGLNPWMDNQQVNRPDLGGVGTCLATWCDLPEDDANREWSELAYYFGAVSLAAGAIQIPYPQNDKVINFDGRILGIDGNCSIEVGKVHGAFINYPFYKVWSFWHTISFYLK